MNDLQRPGESGRAGFLPNTAEDKITMSRKKPPQDLAGMTFSCFKGSVGQMREIFIPRQMEVRLCARCGMGLLQRDGKSPLLRGKKQLRPRPGLQDG